MPTYAVGDIQGCHRTLMALLERLHFDARRDRLWLVGDLVNRGPFSLDVLRWAAAQPESALVVVLGNHDLYLLSRVLAAAPAKSRDTLAALMEAPDRDDLIAWLRRRPLAHTESGHLMVHAGVHPGWSSSGVLALAREAEEAIRAPEAPALLRSREYAAPPPWSEGLSGSGRAASILAHLTRLRTFLVGGTPGSAQPGAHDGGDLPDWDYTGRPHESRGRIAWFDAPERRTRDTTVVFGHWASLGLYRAPGIEGLDSGCVYGQSLTALRLDDGAIIQQPCVDPVG